MRYSSLLYLFVTAMLMPACVVSAWADEPTTPPTISDIPFLDRQEIGAKWAAMGGACIATVDDGSAAYWNPAGLGRIRRIEILGTLSNLSNSIDSEWSGGSNESSVSTTRLDNVAISYPFPTYRGSLVATGSMFRKISYDQFLNRHTEYEADTYSDIEEQEIVLTAWSGGFSVQISPRTFFGAEAHFYTGSQKQRYAFSPWPGCSDAGAHLNTDADLSGYGGIVGFQYVAHPVVTVGATLRTPEKLTIKGTTDGEPRCDNVDFAFEDEITLPYSVGVGIGVMPHSFAVSLDLIYTNWHELDYFGRVRDENDNYLYDPTTDIRAGIEYSLPNLPLRFRGGYAYVPLELTVFSIDKDKSRYSLGTGTVIESALAVDVTWQRTSFERTSGADSYSEKRTLDKAMLTVAYRF